MSLEEFNALLGILDNLLSLALLTAFAVLFVRGDIYSHRQLTTLIEVLEALDNIDIDQLRQK